MQFYQTNVVYPIIVLGFIVACAIEAISALIKEKQICVVGTFLGQ
jgi:hypothetical protein